MKNNFIQLATVLFIFIIIFANNQKSIEQKKYNYNVKIYRDIWGVPHIYGDTDEDVAFGLAYAHSEDDFDTMQKILCLHLVR